MSVDETCKVMKLVPRGAVALDDQTLQVLECYLEEGFYIFGIKICPPIGLTNHELTEWYHDSHISSIIIGQGGCDEITKRREARLLRTLEQQMTWTLGGDHKYPDFRTQYLQALLLLYADPERYEFFSIRESTIDNYVQLGLIELEPIEGIKMVKI